MKILIALASSSGQLSGVQRHAINLARCLLMRDEVTQVHLVAAPWQQEFLRALAPVADARVRLHSAPIGNSARSRNLWFYRQLPHLAVQLSADIVHLAYPAPICRRMFQCPVVATLHDLYPYDIPENFGFPKVFFNRAVLRQCLHSVDAVACVSQSTLLRLHSMYPRIAPKCSTLIYNSVEPSSAGKNDGQLPEWSHHSFLLCVAQHRRNKNVLLALKVFDRLLRSGALTLDSRMIVVGIPGPETAAIHRFIRTSGLNDRVLLLNGISEEHLQWSYRNCLLLLAPSIVEGFGLPVAEALLAGCSVVCSDIPSFRELGSSHCRYVPLGADQEQAFAEAIITTLHSLSPNPVALPQLSPTTVAGEYMRLYRSLLPASFREQLLHASLTSAPTGQPFS